MIFWVEIVVLALHLILAGVAAAGPLVAAVVLWRAIRRDDQATQRAARRLTLSSLHSLLTAIGLGFLLWYLYQRHSDTAAVMRAERLSRNWTIDAWTFWGELGFSAAVLVAAMICLRRSRGLRWLTPILLVLAGTNLLYHLPLRFSIFNLAESRGLDLPDGLTRAIKYQMLADPQLWARLVHHWGAMFVAAGLAWLWIRGSSPVPPVDTSANDAWGGARIILLGVAVQLFTGPWLLFLLPTGRQNNYLGDQVGAMIYLGTGITAALLALLPTFGLAFDTTAARQVQQRRRWLVTLLLVAAWTGMVAGQLVQR